MCGVILVGHVRGDFCWSCVGWFLLVMCGLVFVGHVWGDVWGDFCWSCVGWFLLVMCGVISVGHVWGDSTYECGSTLRLSKFLPNSNVSLTKCFDVSRASVECFFLFFPLSAVFSQH